MDAKGTSRRVAFECLLPDQPRARDDVVARTGLFDLCEDTGSGAWCAVAALALCRGPCALATAASAIDSKAFRIRVTGSVGRLTDRLRAALERIHEEPACRGEYVVARPCRPH